MSQNSLPEINRKKLAEIKEAHPQTTHINFRRADGVLVDIPIHMAGPTIQQRPTWLIEDGAYAQPELRVADAELPVALPTKPSEEEKPEVAEPLAEANMGPKPGNTAGVRKSASRKAK